MHSASHPSSRVSIRKFLLVHMQLQKVWLLRSHGWPLLITFVTFGWSLLPFSCLCATTMMSLPVITAPHQSFRGGHLGQCSSAFHLPLSWNIGICSTFFVDIREGSNSSSRYLQNQWSCPWELCRSASMHLGLTVFLKSNQEQPCFDRTRLGYQPGSLIRIRPSRINQAIPGL